MAAAVNNTEVVVESQVISTQPQLSPTLNNTTSITHKIEEEIHEAASNPSSSSTSPPSSSSTSPVHQPAARLSTFILTPEEDTITSTTATTDIERPVNDNQEITEVIRPDDHNDRTKKSDGGQETSNDALDGYEELYKAAENGNWEVASNFLKKNPEAIKKVIASDERTVLHVAICAGNLMFTKKIVKLMPPDILEYKTCTDGYTALHHAAISGYAKAAKVLVNKNRDLTQIEDKCGRVPLYLAVKSATGKQKVTVEYLYSMTRHQHPSPFSGKNGDALLCGMIDAGYYDIASSLVQQFPELVVDQANEIQTSALNNLAERPFAFASGAKHTSWQRKIYRWVKVDINATYDFDKQTNQESSVENDEEKENPDKFFEGYEEDPVKYFEALLFIIIVGPIALVGAIILLAIWTICFLILLMMTIPLLFHRLLDFLGRFIIPWSPEVKVEKRSDEENPVGTLDVGTEGDQENLVGRFGGSGANEKTSLEKSAEYIGDMVLEFMPRAGRIYQRSLEFVGHMTEYALSTFVIEYLVEIPGRLILTPVARILELRKQCKQLYQDKVKHKQAEDLVSNIFEKIKHKKNEGEVVDFLCGSDVMKVAIKHESVEIVKLCIKLFPQIIWTEMGGKNMIQMAIAQRNKTMLDLICEGSGKNKIELVSRCDYNGNTILHYAAKLAPSTQLNSISGEYLKMQREKQWFKGVENMISEKDRFKRNKDGNTAHNIFTEEHKELKEKGEKWLKDTSGSCMLVAALIATVAFTSAFTVPGGNTSGDSISSNNGFPVFLNKDPFIVFAVADALALFSSITSVLMFLAITTSRYAEVDFLESLPNKLILGLSTLFISMASVLVAFSASLILMLGERYKWAIYPIAVFSLLPVTLFGGFQVPLFWDMIKSTYRGSLFREHTYISSVRLNSKKENQFKKLMAFINSFTTRLSEKPKQI